LSIWAAKEALVRAGVIQSAALREPATVPDDVDRAQSEAFLAQAGLMWQIPGHDITDAGAKSSSNRP
jgi:dihydrodipicolinate synthase/N-acetylneuraminate lyase